MKKTVFVTGSFFFTILVFRQQQQSPNRISNITNVLIQNVSNVNLNNNNNVQVISNPRPRQRVNRPRRSTISSNTSSINNTPIISQRRIVRRPPRRPIARTISSPTVNPVVNVNPSSGNEEPTSTKNLINNSDIQIQNFVSNVSQNPQVQSGNGNSQLNLDIDFSFNVKTTTTVKASSSYAGSSARYKSRTFSKKMAKLKRNFFGKLSGHKKSKRRIDICFNWKS
ncbi:MAG: hypothetical protein SFY56_07710 [Bacteroidota bacterium]|nr:hypothetical protein [Bacteroidota bacterium]